MIFTLEQLRDAAIDLPSDDRAELAQFLVSTLDDQRATSIQSEWMTLAKRRMDDVKAGSVVGISADEVLDNLLGDVD